MIPSILSAQLIQGVKDFLTTTFPSTTPSFFGIMERFVEEEGNLFKGPYISIALPFQKGQGKRRFFPEILDASFLPYYHQELAFKRLSLDKPKPTLVATGTGSGKTESFMYPILDYCRRNKQTKGIKAIIIYPMNALATDQAKRFAKAISSAKALEGVRVGLFVGGDDGKSQSSMSRDYVITDKDILRQNPPDILLTNYKMLDFLLMRPKDQSLWSHNIGSGVLKYLAVDEIHTFDGAGGSDLASLLRRLRAKLKIERGELACIGTSATLGSDGAEAICDFASMVFNERFDKESVISEYRITADEFFEDTENDFFNIPDVRDFELLNFRNYKTTEEYIKKQYLLWFREEIENVEDDDFRTLLGKKLKELSLFKLMLRTVDGRVVHQKKVVEAFKKRFHPGRVDDEYFVALLNSLLALTSWAKGERVGEYLPPFLHVRVQLWLRELTRMVGTLSENPTIKFSHDISTKDKSKYYPLIHCRECHAMGWGGVKKESSSELIDDLDLFYQTFFSHDPRLTFIFPVCKEFIAKNGRVYTIDPVTGVEESADGRGILVYEPDNLTNKHKSHNDCPFCGHRNALTILGSRAASLTSVLIGQGFTSSYNDDKKLITFSDSVQDAAHRAGFFGARSYQFTLRSVMQQTLLAQGRDVSLPQFSKVVTGYWKEKFGSLSKYVATLIAPDMEWLSAYDELQKSGKLPADSDIVNLIDQRLDWSVYSEYGYRSHIGRTLERSGASVAYIESIDEIVEELLPYLENELEMLRGVSKDQVYRFVYGFLLHMKKQGAIFTNHLESYIKSGGNIYAFTNYQKIYMPSFTFKSRSPEFLTTGSFQTFEKIYTKNRTSWCEQWLLSNFMDENLLISGYSSVVYGLVIKILKKHQIIKEQESSGYPIWGLNGEKIFITTQVAKLKCDACQDILMVRLDDLKSIDRMCCLRKGCRGHYEIDKNEDNYYKSLYSYGDIVRIVAKEHTGLLERTQRETIENSFIYRKDDEPWKPNILSATPTLEMGIDIGDLSSVILCSVPPNGANYLQRIGRAGRKDGNAFNATIANAQPHDLYFYSEPMTMMQGNIEAPGVFLDASAILQRQFMAFCIDQWVTEEGVKENEIPHRLSTVLDAISKKSFDTFPYTLINYIQNNTEQLLERFFDLYEGKLHERTKEELKMFASGRVEDAVHSNAPDELKESISLSYKILNRFEQLIAQRDAIARQIDLLRKKIKEHKSSEARDKDWEDQLNELNVELEGLKSVRREINKKVTFEFLTNEGLLPNYAFPESGVILKSIIYRKKEKVQGDDGKGYESFTFEYERPGSSAISELAPSNSFYASGRRVRVDQIDMQISEVETWRFCDQCSYNERESSTVAPQCPKCGSQMWSDAGQKRELIRMKQVIATTSDRESRLKDDSEQREPVFYTKQLLINFEKEQIEDAYVIDSEMVPFGFEFIRKVDFKEINFGASTLTSEEVSIAGKRMPRRGFVICKYCGKVQDRSPTDQNFKAKHTFTCECTDFNDKDNFIESLYLYREFSSEAIRLLLPITTMAISDEKLHSLIAAFQVGLKAYFKGSVDHLRVGTYDEALSDEQYRRRYLVLYDTVPGGTGYLRQLMRDELALFEVLELALQRLISCSCNEDHEKDGCYQCLYAYRNNFDRPLISRDCAKEIIKDILSFRESVKKVETLTGVQATGLFDSELEERFLVEIGRYRKDSISANLQKRITTRQRPGFLLEIGDNVYEIEQQVEFKESDGVAFSCKADFVFYPLRNSALRPIVVFTDGFTYHKDRLGKDSAQRMALMASGKYIVWTLTWEDIYQFAQKKPEYTFVNFLSEKYVNKKMFSMFCSNRSFLQQSSFEWFLELLLSGSEEEWKIRSQAVALSMLKSERIKIKSQKWKSLCSFINNEMVEVLEDITKEFIYGEYQNQNILIQVFGNLEQITRKNYNELSAVLHMVDSDSVLSQDVWAGAMRLFNLFQFLRYAFLTTETGLQNGDYNALRFDLSKKQKSTFSEEWEKVYNDVLDEAKELVKRLSEVAVDIPEVGYEICDDEGVVVAESELAWSDKRIAVFIDDVISIDGWETYSIEDEDTICERLAMKVQ